MLLSRVSTSMCNGRDILGVRVQAKFEQDRFHGDIEKHGENYAGPMAMQGSRSMEATPKHRDYESVELQRLANLKRRTYLQGGIPAFAWCYPLP
jgi:hypothetical protein